MEKVNKKIENNRETVISSNSIIFNEIFKKKENTDSVINFVESVIKEKIISIELDNRPILENDSEVNNLYFIATFDNNIKANVNIKIIDEEKIDKAALDSLAFTYLKAFKDEFHKIYQRTIAIIIDNSIAENLKEINNYYSLWKIKDIHDLSSTLYDDIEIHIIELPKLKKYGNINNSNKDLLLWSKFFENPNLIDETEIKSNNYIKKTKIELKKILQSKHDI